VSIRPELDVNWVADVKSLVSQGAATSAADDSRDVTSVLVESHGVSAPVNQNVAATGRAFSSAAIARTARWAMVRQSFILDGEVEGRVSVLCRE
jgi:hypothetical protein